MSFSMHIAFYVAFPGHILEHQYLVSSCTIFCFRIRLVCCIESGSVPPSFISTSCAERVPISKQIRFACMRARFSSAQATHQNREKDDGKTPILTQKILTQKIFFHLDRISVSGDLISVNVVQQ